MKVDLHNHTPLCNHAEGEIASYIEAAIANKTRFFGFADHAPMDFDPKYRMHFEQMHGYEASVRAAAQKYKEDITVLLGYEVDYLEGHMDKRVLEADVDYLIGSVHFLQGWGFDNPEFLREWQTQDVDEVWKLYFKTIEEMAQSRLFEIVGHLDLIKVFNFLPKESISKIAKNALDAIKENGMVLEVNGAGLRKPVKEAYPSRTLLEEAFKRKIPITLSSDAHTPQQVGMFAKETEALVRSVGYTECCYFQKKERFTLSL